MHVDALILRRSTRVRQANAGATAVTSPTTPSPTSHLGRSADKQPKDAAPSNGGTRKPPNVDPALAEWVDICTGKKAVFEWVSKQKATALKNFVIKDTWVPFTRMHTEVEVLRAVGESYGFVRYLGHMVLPHRGLEQLALFSNAKNCPESWMCEDWLRVYLDGKEPYFNARVHQLIFYSTVGTSLTAIAHDPWAVAQSMKDVVTALYILFTKGWLHRDVALGNVIPLLDWEENTEDKIDSVWRAFDLDPRFEKLRGMFSHQRSVLSDFDQAVKWGVERAHPPSRSGTPAFLSGARSAAWVLRRDRIDTLFDDLESITWAHFYAVLRRIIEALKPTANEDNDNDNDNDNDSDSDSDDEAIDVDDSDEDADGDILEAGFAELEARHFETFNGDDGYTLTAVKEWILKYGSGDKPIGARVLATTWPLWRRMFRAANAARDIADDFAERLSKEGVPTFGQASAELQTALRQACKDVAFVYLEAINDTLANEFAQYDPFNGPSSDSNDSNPFV
ncbi:hypothetical protein AURDEDRAFT_155018 [Auricularia subglabra TFB-10046 SS5]|uniref:Fungal-type protein kinase domain-containing protein n=1 Tax=Auricularia subglabra (strain TFB-10046 / SS5) TaxID=717982 RepID=J0CW35_AURST|nr:hypothetical protein AURDEDRAFT_155018 [Auricularia subglabra TFB-10046 SS5]